MDSVLDYMTSVVFGDTPTKKPEQLEVNKSLEAGTKKDEKQKDPIEEKKNIWLSNIAEDLKDVNIIKIGEALYSFIQTSRKNKEDPMTIKQLKHFLYKKIRIIPPFPEKVGIRRDFDHPLFVILDGIVKLETTDLMSGRECSFGGVEIEANIPEGDDSFFLIDFEILSVSSNVSAPLEFKLGCGCDENREWLPCSMISLNGANYKTAEGQELPFKGISNYRSLLNGIESKCGPRFIRDDIWGLFLGDLGENNLDTLFEFVTPKTSNFARNTKNVTEIEDAFCYIKNTLETTIALIYIRDIYIFIEPELSLNIDICMLKSVATSYRIDAIHGGRILEILKFNLRKNSRNSLDIKARIFDYALKLRNSSSVRTDIMEKKIVEVKYALVYRRQNTKKILLDRTQKEVPSDQIVETKPI